MSTLLYEAENIIAPIVNGSGTGAKNRIGAFAVTTSSGRTNLATYLSDWNDGHYITLVAPENLYISFNKADSGSVDETNVTAGNATVAWLVPAYSYFHFRIVRDYSWLIAKAASACTVRVYLSSDAPTGDTVL